MLRNQVFHAELTTHTQKRNGPLDCGPHLNLRLHERGGVLPLTHFFLEFHAFVDFQHAVFRNADSRPFQRTGSRPFKVDARNVKAGAMAGAFELLLPFQPVGRATEMRADRGQRIEQVLAFVLVGVDDPHAELVFPFVRHGVERVIAGRADLEF